MIVYSAYSKYSSHYVMLQYIIVVSRSRRGGDTFSLTPVLCTQPLYVFVSQTPNTQVFFFFTLSFRPHR